MKLFAIAITAAALAAFAPITAKAHSYHTPQVCSATSADLCAHLGFKAEPNSTDATEFMLHFMPAAGVDAKEIKNVTVKLWMDMGGHGHGSSPVTITQGDDVHYAVSDAYFVMPGEWQVKVGFDYLGTAHEIVIPVEVK